MNKNTQIKTYSTSQIANIVGLHPNTVRMYEEWGLIQKVERKKNGYRVFYDIHIKQFELAKKAFHVEVLQAGLRKKIIEVVKLSAQYKFDEAIRLTEEYIQIAKREIDNAREAADICQELFMNKSEDGRLYKRAQAAKELRVSIDTIRNWEMNGLITVKRKENGYRIYNQNDMNRLKIIRSLRCANYSLSAILRMLNKLESQYNIIDENNNSLKIPEKEEILDSFKTLEKEEILDSFKIPEKEEILDLLNTPDDDENIVSACDKLVVSLDNAIKNAYDVIQILQEIKKMKK